jgi:hypothetical protein
MPGKPAGASAPWWRRLRVRLVEILSGFTRTSSSGCAGDPNMYDPRIAPPKTKD